MAESAADVGKDSVADTEPCKDEKQQNEKMTAQWELFKKMKASDHHPDVYIKEGPNKWNVVSCRYMHSKLPKFMVEDGTWHFVDPETMTLEKPEGYVPQRKRANSTGDIPSMNSGVKFSNKTTYGPVNRMYRPRYQIPEKPEHGFAGLKNQGATCYLNSLLQTLYMTMELREAIFQWEYDSKLDIDKSQCMTYQLQELFARLQASRQGAATTSALTKSFGWSGAEVYQQHDVVELAQVLFDFMAEKAHNERLKNVVQQFRCEISSYVECLEHGDRRENKQPLVGVPLAIKEVDTLDEAFQRYLDFEILDGDNAVMNEVVGRKTRSKKGVAFSRFGQFLSIQLGRWTLNLRNLQREKVHKPIQFGFELDVAPFINSETPIRYELYSMMIHRGGAYGGHYYAYIKDFKTGKWFEFNDASVTEIPEEEMNRMMDIEYCKETEKRNYRQKTSPLVGAYMLMYRRIDEDPKIEVSNELIPEELRDLIKKEDDKWLKKRTEFWLRISYEERKEEVVFDRNETFGNQLEKVLTEFGIDTGTAKENIRFRAAHMGRKARPFEDIDQHFVDIGMEDGDAVFMEIKKPGEDFEEVAVDWIKLKVIGLDYETMETKKLGTIKVDKEGKTNQIRTECAKLLGVPNQECKIYCRYDRDGDPDLDAMDYDNIDVDSVVRHVVEIWADKCSDWDQEETTPIYEVFEEKKHFITLEFNKPGSYDFTESIDVDDRKTIKEIRQMIGTHLDIDPMSFIVGRKFESEIKELNKPLCRCYVSRRLCLREGKPLVDGQYRTGIWLDSGEIGEERFTPLRNNFVVQKTWSLEDFHRALMEVEEDDENVPPLELMRLRKKFRENMTEFVPAKGSMKDLQGLIDGFQIVIQRLKEPEELKKSDLILRLVRLRPETRSVDQEEHEIVIPRKTPINQFGAKAILPIIGDEIPLEHLQWAKAVSYPKRLDELKWKEAGDDDAKTLYKGFFKNGVVVLYRDKRKIPENDEESDVRGEVGSQGGSGSYHRSRNIVSRYRPKERGIKIFSAQEQEERNNQHKRRRGSSDEKMMEPYEVRDRERGRSL